MKELILGGARSGKSRLAESRAGASGLEVVYIATATAGDDEMSRRVQQHRQRRPPGWSLVEEPLSLAATLQAHAGAHRCLLVDCLTLWLSNLLQAGEQRTTHERDALLSVFPTLPGHLLLVSNEVGSGIVPLGELSRRFVDEAGRLHQVLAGQCDRVTLAVAGLPLTLKGGAA